jgi:hypothetical protein
VSRGKPKPKISDISRTPPTREELEALTNYLGKDELHPITVAILGAVLVEHELDNQLRRRLKCSDDAWNELLSDVGPLRNFHSKIVMGRALRMYDDDVRFNLNIVRNIRNQFAHSKKLISFDNVLIAKEVGGAKHIPRERKHFDYVINNRYGTQYGYKSLCMLLTVFLMRLGTRSAEAKTRYYQKRAAKLSPWSLGLWNILVPPIDVQKLPHLSSLVTQSGDPKSEAPKGLLSALLEKRSKSGDSTDK